MLTPVDKLPNLGRYTSSATNGVISDILMISNVFTMFESKNSSIKLLSICIYRVDLFSSTQHSPTQSVFRQFCTKAQTQAITELYAHLQKVLVVTRLALFKGIIIKPQDYKLGYNVYLAVQNFLCRIYFNFVFLCNSSTVTTGHGKLLYQYCV